MKKQEITARDTKTYHDRKVVISIKCVNARTDYLESRPVSESEAVFMSQKKGRISRGRVCAIVKEYARLAGITRNVTPHVLRHTFATKRNKGDHCQHVLHGLFFIDTTSVRVLFRN